MRKGQKQGWRARLLLPVAGVLLSAALAPAQQDKLAQAHAALDAGEADKALGLLYALPQNGANNAEAQNLACRVYLTLKQWDQAASRCEAATRLDGGNSNLHLWLGRALGERAGHISFLSAYSLGKRSRAEFETAVRLNARNAEALSDLGEFYVEAPGVVGGGQDKAERVIAQLEPVDSARAHQLRARLAEARKDYGAAEREFRAAIASSPHPALHWTTLASFFRRRQRWQDVDAAVHSAYAAASHDRGATVALYDGAGVLIESHRDPGFASKMLEAYLASSGKTEEGPAFEAHLRLARLKAQFGDRAAAEHERTQALALAHAYKPAQEAKF
jgi:predicted Zn-dependent protease